MSTSFEIRAAMKADMPRIVALLSELNHSEGYAITPDSETLAAALFGGSREVDVRALVVEAEGVVIALALYYPGYDSVSGGKGYHLADIIVTQSHRRQGIARQLFTTLARQALAEKKQWVSLTVLRKNEAARGFYACLGMTHVEVDFFAIGEIGLTAVINAK